MNNYICNQIYIFSVVDQDEVVWEGCLYFVIQVKIFLFQSQFWGGVFLRLIFIFLKLEGFIKLERFAGFKGFEMFRYMQVDFFSNIVNGTVMMYWLSMNFFCWNCKLFIFDMNVFFFSDICLIIVVKLFFFEYFVLIFIFLRLEQETI